MGSKQAPFKCCTAINTDSSIKSLWCFPFPAGLGRKSHKPLLSTLNYAEHTTFSVLNMIFHSCVVLSRFSCLNAPKMGPTVIQTMFNKLSKGEEREAATLVIQNRCKLGWKNCFVYYIGLWWMKSRHGVSHKCNEKGVSVFGFEVWQTPGHILIIQQWKVKGRARARLLKPEHLQMLTCSTDPRLYKGWSRNPRPWASPLCEEPKPLPRLYSSPPLAQKSYK